MAHDASGAQTLGFAHIGLTVPDLGRAVDWYQRVLGFRLLLGPVELKADESHAGRQATDVFGSGFASFRQAHLLGANGVALEMFEFVDPPTPREPPPFDYWRPGVFHLCLLAPDIERVATDIAKSGGRLRTSRVWDVFEGEPYRMCYCEDPFGNILELYSHPHQQVFATRTGW
jgi:catechol 2,3-dioxygenase-like lactoylglutathione lyase family enzyme